MVTVSRICLDRLKARAPRERYVIWEVDGAMNDRHDESPDPTDRREVVAPRDLRVERQVAAHVPPARAPDELR